MTSEIHFAFVHGGGQGSWIWDETIAAMRAQDNGSLGQLLALDAPGCGLKRDRKTEGLGIREVATELVSDIEQAGLSNVVLVGHSQAGQLLPFMTRLRPGLFSRLIYVSCTAPLPGQNVVQLVGRAPYEDAAEQITLPDDGPADDPTVRATHMFCNDMAATQTAEFLAKLGRDNWPVQTYSESDWAYDNLGGIPASYVACLEDRSLPYTWQLKFAERFKADRVVRIDAGHQVMNSRPQGLAEILRIETMGAS